jgi:hypothetical protein
MASLDRLISAELSLRWVVRREPEDDGGVDGGPGQAEESPDMLVWSTGRDLQASEAALASAASSAATVGGSGGSP